MREANPESFLPYFSSTKYTPEKDFITAIISIVLSRMYVSWIMVKKVPTSQCETPNTN